MMVARQFTAWDAYKKGAPSQRDGMIESVNGVLRSKA